MGFCATSPFLPQDLGATSKISFRWGQFSSLFCFFFCLMGYCCNLFCSAPALPSGKALLTSLSTKSNPCQLPHLGRQLQNLHNSQRHLVQLPCLGQKHPSPDQVAKSPTQPDLERFQGDDGASTTSLGYLLQCLTTVIVKNVFLMSNLNLPSFSLKPLPLVLSLEALVKSLSPSFL